MTDLVSNAKLADVHITLLSGYFYYMMSYYLEPYALATATKWAMQHFVGVANSIYPTTFSQLNTGGSNHVGNYSDPKADELINASITSSDPAAVRAEASYLTTAQPTMFEPNNDYTRAWKTNVAATKPEAFENLTQYYSTPEYWYLTG